MKLRSLFTLAFLTLCVGVARADDFAQWRGPNRDGVSKETGLLKKWPAEGPKVAWQVSDLGTGYGSPAVVGDKVFLIDNKGLEDEQCLCLKFGSSDRVWTTKLGKVGEPNQQPSYPASRSTPTVDGDAVYALGSDGDFVCLDAASGKQRWRKNLRTDFGGQPGKWAYAESPLVDGDAVVVTPGGNRSAIVSLNKKTGEVIWKAVVPGGDQAGYSSIIIADIGGVKQYVTFLEKGVVGVDAKTGAFLWRYENPAKGSAANIPTPVTHGNDVYEGTGQGGSGLVTLSNTGGKFSAKEVYFSKKLPSALGGSVLVDNYLYGTNAAVLICVDFKTGKEKWTNRSVGESSVLYADGNLYLHAINGDVALVAASPDGYKELGRFTPPGSPERAGGKAWAYPVISNGKLYVRDANMLWAFDIKG